MSQMQMLAWSLGKSGTAAEIMRALRSLHVCARIEALNGTGAPFSLDSTHADLRANHSCSRNALSRSHETDQRNAHVERRDDAKLSATGDARALRDLLPAALFSTRS